MQVHDASRPQRSGIGAHPACKKDTGPRSDTQTEPDGHPPSKQERVYHGGTSIPPRGATPHPPSPPTAASTPVSRSTLPASSASTPASSAYTPLSGGVTPASLNRTPASVALAVASTLATSTGEPSRTCVRAPQEASANVQTNGRIDAHGQPRMVQWSTRSGASYARS